ncbi:MAG: DNA repair protein RecN [Actinomyces sp.]|nr:DNA repair protein RecN [Actinomyces sp.]
MIESLRIRSLGVIEAADLEFGRGLTVLTGETGAGKTMVLTSLQLLLGGRADPAIVRTGAERAEVDGVFEIGEGAAATAAEDLGVDVEDGELIVSRTVARRARSRARLGGRPVPVSTLADLGGELVTIHGQSDQMRLRHASAQREVLDAYGDSAHASLVEDYHRCWNAAVQARRRRDEGRESAHAREAEIRSLEQATRAIAELDIREGEDDDLRAETERLTNVEDLREAVGRARAALHGSEDAVGALDLVRASQDALRDGAAFDRDLEAQVRRLSSCLLELDSLADDLSAYQSGLSTDPQRLAQGHERRAALRELLGGRAADATGLLAWQERALARLAELTAPATDPEVLERQLLDAQAEVIAAGGRLSESRAVLAQRLSGAVDTELHGLAMRDAHVAIRLDPHKPGPHGCEDVGFWLSPHPDAPERPLGQGASGGELSRVMLALEVVTGTREDPRTFVFDEVDAGIGGRTATEVGSRLARLAGSHQVVVVTHLPQVAAFADVHLVVDKAGATTTVRPVEGDSRLFEIARMMGGDPDSEAARRHALELLEGAGVQQSRS